MPDFDRLREILSRTSGAQERAEARDIIIIAEEETKRIDWLSLQNVTVSIPLLYGSRTGFVARPDADQDDGQIHPSNIREEIDKMKEKK